MYFTSGSDRAFEQLMQGKPGFDHYASGEAVTPEDCGTCLFYRPHWKYQFCVYAECPYQTATDLLRRCASRRRPALFVAPGPGDWQRGGPDYGVCHAAGLAVGPV